MQDQPEQIVKETSPELVVGEDEARKDLPNISPTREQRSKLTTLLQCAPLWQRAAAAIVDCVLVLLMSAGPLIAALMALLVAFGATHGHSAITDAYAAEIFNHKVWQIALMITMFWMIFVAIFAWAYFTVFDSSARQATLGKRLFRLRVVNAEGKRLPFVSASYHVLATFRTVFGGLLLMGIAAALMDPFVHFAGLPLLLLPFILSYSPAITSATKQSRIDIKTGRFVIPADQAKTSTSRGFTPLEITALVMIFIGQILMAVVTYYFHYAS